VDGFLGLGPVVLARIFTPADKAGLVQVGMIRGMQSGAGRVVRSGPAFPVIVQIAEHVEVLLPARWTGIEILAARQVQTGNDKVQFMMPGMVVPYPKNIALIRLQPGKGDGFKVVHDAFFLFRRYRVVRMPGENASSELPFSIYGVDEVTGRVRIAA
jgi:hypothetical protein